jgi:hypothetical protein
MFFFIKTTWKKELLVTPKYLDKYLKSQSIDILYINGQHFEWFCASLIFVILTLL